MGKKSEVRREKGGVWTQTETGGEGGGGGMGGEKGKGRSVDQTEKRHSVLLRFSRDSVYNTKAVCANGEFVNC